MDTNEKATTLKELVKTKEYKESNYKLMRVDEKYGLKEKKLGKYLDLVATKLHHWDIKENYYDDCIGNEKVVIEAFYRRYFFEEEMEEKFRETPFEKENTKETLASYKSKLLEGLS